MRTEPGRRINAAHAAQVAMFIAQNREKVENMTSVAAVRDLLRDELKSNISTPTVGEILKEMGIKVRHRQGARGFYLHHQLLIRAVFELYGKLGEPIPDYLHPLAAKYGK